MKEFVEVFSLNLETIRFHSVICSCVVDPRDGDRFFSRIFSIYHLERSKEWVLGGGGQVACYEPKETGARSAQALSAAKAKRTCNTDTAK